MTVLNRCLAGLAFALILAPTVVDARCISPRLRFEFGASQALNSIVDVYDGGCTRTFRGGLNVTYESVSVVKRPAHMRITPLSNGFGYRLTVNGGYKGPDAYTIRACGRSPGGNGCTTFNYAVTIK